MTQALTVQHGTKDVKKRLSAASGYAWLALFWVIQVFVHVWWIQVDTRPPFYDIAGQAILAVRLARAPFVSDPLSAGRALLGIGPYPPFVHLVSVPFALLMSPTVDALLGAQTLFMAILLVSTYELGRRLDGPSTGLAAALLVGMYPIVYGLSRHYLLDVPLVAVVTWAICCLVCADGFRHLPASLWFGVAVGLGMLTKWTFVIFVAAPFIISLAAMLAQYSPKRLRNGLLSVLVGSGIAAPWYFWHLADLGSFLQIGGVYAGLEGDPLVRSWKAWTYYANALANEQVFLPFVLLFVLGLALLLVKRKLDKPLLMILAWFLVPYLAFSAFVNKDTRYVLPYLPAIALISALGMAQIRNRKIARAIWAIVAVYAVAQFTGLSFGISHRLPGELVPAHASLRLGGHRLALYKESVHIASPPRAEDWRVQEILEDILQDSAVSEPPERTIRLMVVPNQLFFEPQGFIYYAEKERLPVQVDFVTGIESQGGASQVQESDYVVLKTGDLGPLWSLQDAVALTQAIQDPTNVLGRQFVQVGEYALPDGSVARLYRHERS